MPRGGRTWVEAATADFIEAVARAADAFAPAGITVCVEPLRRAETNVLNTVAEAAALASSLPGVRVTADMYHMMENGESLQFEGIGGLIGHAHVADTARVPPGQGSADFGAFFRALRQAGYTGRVSIECAWTDFGEEVGRAVVAVRRRQTFS